VGEFGWPSGQKVILKCGGQLIGEFEKLPSNGGGRGNRFRIYLT
jgi:hypothetical protein